MTGLKESMIIDLIAKYTVEAGEMPKYLYGNYNALSQISYMSNFVHNNVGEGVYLTVLGPVKLMLDSKSEHIYVIGEEL